MKSLQKNHMKRNKKTLIPDLTDEQLLDATALLVRREGDLQLSFALLYDEAERRGLVSDEEVCSICEAMARGEV